MTKKQRAQVRKRSEAARKGWETRQRNARKAERQAAKERRAERERARKRSEAAKKGWETRQRNAKEKARKERMKKRRREVVDEGEEQEFIAIGEYIGD